MSFSKDMSRIKIFLLYEPTEYPFLSFINREESCKLVLPVTRGLISMTYGLSEGFLLTEMFCILDYFPNDFKIKVIVLLIFNSIL